MDLHYLPSSSRVRPLVLWCYGIRVVRVINQDVHDATLRRTVNDYPPSKNPKAFGIDLHVDDLIGVRMEGEQHGFEVVVVAPNNESWAEEVWSAATKTLSRQAKP